MFNFCLYFLWGCQNYLPEPLFVGKLPPTLIELPFKDTPQVLNRVEVRRWWWPCHDFCSPLMPIAAKASMVFFVAWDGALTCMKMILLWKAQFFLLYHGKKCAVRNSTYFAEVILTPSDTFKGPTDTLPMILAQNIPPPPHCWCCSLVGTWCPSTNHPELHPSGPSSVARLSPVNKTVWKLVFIYLVFTGIVSLCGHWLRVAEIQLYAH